MSYIASTGIDVFPSTRRSSYPTSRLMSEENVVSIVNKFLDTDGFVISDSLTEAGLDFNIHGYYFHVEYAPLIAAANSIANSDIYAHIILTTTENSESGENYIELWGQDNDNVFQGLTLTGNTNNPEDPNPPEAGQQTTTEFYHLKILTRTENNDYVIPDESKFKFLEKSVDFEVDGGVI